MRDGESWTREIDQAPLVAGLTKADVDELWTWIVGGLAAAIATMVIAGAIAVN